MDLTESLKISQHDILVDTVYIPLEENYKAKYDYKVRSDAKVLPFNHQEFKAKYQEIMNSNQPIDAF